MKNRPYAQLGNTLEIPKPNLSPSLSARITRFRRSRVFDLGVRVLGGAWFLLLAVVVAKGIIVELNHPGAMSSGAIWASILSKCCLVVFYLVLCGLLIIRPPAVAQSGGFLPSIAAFAGTYMPWSITLLGHTQSSTILNTLSAACLAVGMLLAMYTVLNLGRSFSIVPQARRVVQIGPYRWIKHPLYLSEEIAVLGAVLQVFSPGAVLLLLAHIAVQITRILFEEKLLRQTLPEYEIYEASRWRLLPHLW
jgi:protein-S-isoprenylcysteine O-methyltransferase Ste14